MELSDFHKEILEIGSNRIIVVGELEGRIAATGQLVLKEVDNDPELADGFRIAHIHKVWVRKDLQRRGLAKQVMRHLEEIAVGLGFNILTLGVDDFNAGALKLYCSLGFEEFKREPGRFPGEQLILMRKALAAT